MAIENAMKKHTLSKSAIFDTCDVILEEVDIPEWGGIVYVRTMSVGDRDRLEQSTMKGDGVDTRQWREKIVVATCCDEKGELLFTPDDMEALAKKSTQAMDRIVDAAQKLNGMTQETIDELGED